MRGIFLGLGSNCGDCLRLLRDALVLLEEVGVVCVKKSSVYETAPVSAEGGNFLNMVVEVETDLSVNDLMKTCLEVEEKLGRVREKMGTGDLTLAGARVWSARTIDIDVLLYGDLIMDGPKDDVIVPHERMHERNFVLVPMVEIGVEVVHPILCVSMGELLRMCGDENWVRLSEKRM